MHTYQGLRTHREEWLASDLFPRHESLELSIDRILFFAQIGILSTLDHLCKACQLDVLSYRA